MRGRVDVHWATPSLARRELLVGVEVERAGRYRRDEDRARFVTGVVMTRTVVGELLGVEPREVPLDRTDPRTGEPNGPPRTPGLHLSISHSGDRVALAVALEPVGVDVERMDRRTKVERLTARVMTAAERAAFEQLPEDERVAAFLRIWTRKEALLKARGTGLTVEANTVSADEPGLHDLDAGPGYVAALYAPGLEIRSTSWRPAGPL